MPSIFLVGQKVSYAFYGAQETARIVRITGEILFLDNGRWMHAISCIVVNEGQ